jgi:hypothetical protein
MREDIRRFNDHDMSCVLYAKVIPKQKKNEYIFYLIINKVTF